MVQYCRKCGHELEDDAEFCDSCGFRLTNDPTQKTNDVESSENKSNNVKNDKSEFINKLPLILAAIGIIAAIGEGLGTPMLMGWDNIMLAMAIGIIGGLIGIFLMEKMEEPLIAAAEFIVTGIIVFMFIGRFGEISAALFIIAGILTLYLKGMHNTNKILWAIPILTFVLVFVALIAGGALYQMNAENSVVIGNLSQNITDDGYGYYTGYLTGDIHIDSNFDYLSVKVDYYDSEDKIIDSSIGWYSSNPQSGNTYKISSWYWEKIQPVKATVYVVDSANDDTPLYSENMTIVTSSGV